MAASSTWLAVADALAQPRGASVWKMILGPQNAVQSDVAHLSALEVGVILVGSGRTGGQRHRRHEGAELPGGPLTELAQVVQESFGAGAPVNSSIFVQDTEGVDPALTRAVYRIVQELLTNARKHAPGQPVFLTVEASPASTSVANRVGIAVLAERTGLLLSAG